MSAQRLEAPCCRVHKPSEGQGSLVSGDPVTIKPFRNERRVIPYPTLRDVGVVGTIVVFFERGRLPQALPLCPFAPQHLGRSSFIYRVDVLLKHSNKRQRGRDDASILGCLRQRREHHKLRFWDRLKDIQATHCLYRDLEKSDLSSIFSAGVVPSNPDRHNIVLKGYRRSKVVFA